MADATDPDKLVKVNLTPREYSNAYIAAANYGIDKGCQVMQTFEEYVGDTVRIKEEMKHMVPYDELGAVARLSILYGEHRCSEGDRAEGEKYIEAGTLIKEQLKGQSAWEEIDLDPFLEDSNED